MTTTPAQIISVERTPGWWKCRTLSGEWVNVFAPSGMKPGTLRFFEAAGYGDLLAVMHVGETLRFSRHPIGVEMTKDSSGRYWEIAAVRPGNVEPDVAIVPDARLHREAVQAWAYLMLDYRFYVLDTETTGVLAHDEPIQIAWVEHHRGEMHPPFPRCYHVRPSDWSLMEQQNGAKEIHGLTRSDLQDAESFHVVRMRLANAISMELVLGYNIDFDMARIEHACNVHELTPITPLATVDVMPLVSRYIGLWDAVKERWQPWRLSEAAEILGIGDRDDHDALGDCRTTLALVQRMAEGVEPDMTAAERIRAEKEEERA